MRFVRSTWSAVRASRDIISVPGSKMNASASRVAVCVLILDLPVRRGIIQTPKIGVADALIDSDGRPDHDLALVSMRRKSNSTDVCIAQPARQENFVFSAP